MHVLEESKSTHNAEFGISNVYLQDQVPLFPLQFHECLVTAVKAYLFCVIMLFSTDIIPWIHLS